MSEPEVDYETVECPRCGGYEALRVRCAHCEGVGAIQQPIRPGHETLSALRAKMGTAKDPERNRYHGAGVRPKHSDPLWSGHDPNPFG